MVPVILFILLIIPATISPVYAQEQWVTAPGFGPSYISDTIPDTLLPGHSYPVLVTFRNTGLVSWQDEMRRIGLLYEGDMTKVTAIPSFVEISRDLNITPGKHATFGFTLLPVGTPGSYDLSFSVVMRSATGDQKITEVFVKHVTIVPTDGISSPVNGSIFVESWVLDLDVYLDSAFMGNVPAIIADVKPGQYRIQVKNDTFERTYPVDVERGVMTRLLVKGDEKSPVITKKKAGPVSDGTIIGYIEANIPLIMIISMILLVCIGVGMYGLRKRNRTEEERKKKEDKEDEEDPEKERAKKEKNLLDKIHSQKPLFEGLSPSSDPISSGRITAMPISGQNVKGYDSKVRGVGKSIIGKESSDGGKKPDSPQVAPDIEVRVQGIDVKQGSAIASLGVSNHSGSPISIDDQSIGAGGFGLIPVGLKEPVDDNPDVIFPLRIIFEGSEIIRKISIHYNRGIALLARGVVEKAYEYFLSVLHADPKNIEALLHQAHILIGWGLEEEASALLAEIIEMDPTNTEAKNALKKLEQDQVRRKENREPDPKPTIKDYPDELLDRYTPIRVLGDDPFATVILVRKNDTGDLRALKIPRPIEKIGSSLFTEISLLYQLRHPYVLRMYKAEFTPVVMLELEFVSGGWYEGKQYMRVSDLPVPLPFPVSFLLIEKIAEGLAYLHRQGVRHYHLSPKYILLDEPLNPKISGLIRESLRSAGGSGVEEFFVCAPEQVDSSFFGKPGKRTDIFQLGAIWLWLMTGRIMGKEESADEIISMTMGNVSSDPPLELYIPLVKKLTARFKKDRYASVEAFLDELKEIKSDFDMREGMASSGDDG
ncbi:protein kinase [Methanospirillum hungatei]|uniref:protein kinase domain-containing protein n=1 Tax=Methanospirillum hungatei TaxID=2203 RepID=UPI0026EB0E5A|nr:protein kinase [Methanospirillum hungatei]MCA1916107.1 protein kinase [Methanospirillum hungatei]